MTATQPETGTAPLIGLPAPAEPVSAEITTGPDDTVIVTIVGGGSATATAVLSRALHAALDARPGSLLLDLGRLDHAAVAPVLRCAEQRARSQATVLEILPQA